MIRIIKGDLFDVSKEYALAHCISSDFAVGAGIAKIFDEKFKLKTFLNSHCVNNKGLYPIVVETKLKNRMIFNLVTKNKYWHKPTLKNLSCTLEELKFKMDYFGIAKVAMPKIGCGLDRLKWDDVYEVLNNLFKDVKYDIVIYEL